MRLRKQEITALSLLGVIVLALSYYLFVVSPAIAREDSLKRLIRKKEADFAKMVELNGKWKGLKHNQAEAEKILTKRGKRFTLLSFLEGISREVGISNKIAYMKPLSFPEESGALKQDGMEVKLEEVDVTELVKYLKKIEYSGKLLNIRRIKVQRVVGREGSSSLRVTLQVNTYI